MRGRARIKRTMWSRRAQEYEAKINSGDLISIAEVVRDLFRSENQPEQSYSERQLYEAALDRMSREISSVNSISETEAIRQIEQNLAKSPRRGVKPERRRGAGRGQGSGLTFAASPVFTEIGRRWGTIGARSVFRSWQRLPPRSRAASQHCVTRAGRSAP